MASHIDMQRLAHDAAAVRALARSLLSLAGAEWTDWEHEFLDNMALHDGPEPLSQRQREVLVELRDNARSHARIDGFSVAHLIRDCWLARTDLLEEDEAFIDGLKRSGATSLKRRQLFRLLRCAKELGIIDRPVRLGDAGPAPATWTRSRRSASR